MLIRELQSVSFIHAEQRNVCNVRVYSYEGRVVVIASEILTDQGWYANFGAALSVAIEDVAVYILAEVGRWDDFIIHTPARYAEDEDWSLIGFSTGKLDTHMMHSSRPRFRNARIIRLVRAQVETRFIGEPFPPVPTRSKR